MPSQTLPNRDFFHAASSDGHVFDPEAGPPDVNDLHQLCERLLGELTGMKRPDGILGQHRGG